MKPKLFCNKCKEECTTEFKVERHFFEKPSSCSVYNNYYHIQCFPNINILSSEKNRLMGKR